MINVLVSNDDGIHAEGIQTLNKVISEVCKTTVIAPAQERSTTGHSLSLDTPLRMQQTQSNQWACSGFPADCVLMGIGHLMKEDRPQLVVSGINRDANLGQDLFYSGTLAAAREACFHGIPSIGVSLSLDKNKDILNYEAAAIFVAELIKNKVHQYIPRLSYININVPNLPLHEIKGARMTKVGFKHYAEDIDHRVDSRGRPYYWVSGTYQGFEQEQDTDCFAIDQGYISVTPHHVCSLSSHDFDQIADIVEKLEFPKGLV